MLLVIILLSEVQVPLWLEITSIAATIFFAGATAFYAWRQHALDKTNTKIALYDRRLAIFKEIQDYLSSITNRQEVSLNMTDDFLKEIRESEFLFNDKEIKTFIKEIYVKGNNLHRFMVRKEKGHNETLTSEMEKEYEWFNQQNQRANELFEKYLNLNK